MNTQWACGVSAWLFAISICYEYQKHKKLHPLIKLLTAVKTYIFKREARLLDCPLCNHLASKNIALD